MKNDLTLIFLFILFSCSHEKKEYLINNRLEAIPHRQGATTRSLGIRDFSIADGTEYLFDSIALTSCWCVLDKDTLTVDVGYNSEVVHSAIFQLTQDTYSSHVSFFSDVNEYNGSHSMNIATVADELILNRATFMAGDTLLGQFALRSDTIKFENWNVPILFKGRFQCIVEKKEKFHEEP